MSKGGFVILLLCLVTAGACTNENVEWGDVSYRSPARGDSLPAVRVSPVTADGPEDSRECFGSLRMSKAKGSLFAAWWSVQPDSSAGLLVAESRNNHSWTAAVTADSSDRSASGCRRPPPAIYADSTNGYVHLAYFLASSAGAGVFAVHSMDGAKSFHSVVPVAFGDSILETAISSEGDRVAVAYVQPVGSLAQVYVATSKTAGHIFLPPAPVSGEGADASAPRVAIRGTKLEVSWLERLPRHPAVERIAFRIGTLK